MSCACRNSSFPSSILKNTPDFPNQIVHPLPGFSGNRPRNIREKIGLRLQHDILLPYRKVDIVPVFRKEYTEICGFSTLFGQLNTDTFNMVIGFSQAGSIQQGNRQPR